MSKAPHHERFHESVEQENTAADAAPLSKWENFKNSISNRNSSFLSRLPYLKGRSTTNNSHKETLEKSRKVFNSDSCHDRGVLLAGSQSSNAVSLPGSFARQKSVVFVLKDGKIFLPLKKC
uniref:Uncharacterized protein n=1 Tax=Romanomermis culicivorax TaxID=13658 RepID=A0A915LB94_ROMCU